MLKVPQITNLTKLIKLFTYISATVLLMVNNNFDKFKYLIPILILIFFLSYSRDYYLVPELEDQPTKYIWISIVVELLLIIGIGLIDKNDINLLLFYICISSTTIIHPFIYSVFIISIYFLLTFLIYAIVNGVDNLMNSVVSIIFNYGVSIAFVVGMSYLVKIQIREKEKFARMNMELERAYEKVIESSAAAQKLSVELERTRMAREIHDTLAYTLTNLVVQLEVCKKLSQVDPSRLPAELEKAQELSRSGFNDVKLSIKALRPHNMGEKSFFASINSMIHETMENTNVHITLNNLLSNDMKFPSQVEIALFRVIQESITNSIRHGEANEIKIHIEKIKDTLQLNIIDDGVGGTNIKKGYGMQGIQERIEDLNGSVEFSTSQGKGFKTRILIPYEVI